MAGIQSIANNLLSNVFKNNDDDKPKKGSEARVPDIAKAERSRTDIPPNREVLVSWSVPLRTYTPRTKDYFRRLVALIFIIGALLILFGQFVMLALIVSLAVLYYVLSSIPPETVRHELDNYGIFCFNKEYYWEELKYFYTTQDGGFEVLHVDTKDPLPGRLILLLDEGNKAKVLDIMGQKLVRKTEAPASVLDKALKRIANSLSLD